MSEPIGRRLPGLSFRRLIALCVMTASTANAADGRGLLEVTKDGTKLEGKLEIKEQDVCWLLGRDGRLTELEINEIDSIRKLGPQFDGYSSAELRSQLRREFGSKFEVVGTAHFLVCAVKDAKNYAELFEDTYRVFYRYFSVRGFKLSEPEFPLVAIVFPTQSGFAAYCRTDGLNPQNGLLGYYMRLSNRVALFDDRDGATATNDSASRSQASFSSMFRRLDDERFSFETTAARTAAGAPGGRVGGGLRDTIVHETTHQAAFNTGLHGRITETPKWVIEGLATMFEAPGIRDSQKSNPVLVRMNRDRFLWFGAYLKDRRKPGALATFVGNDDQFTRSALDAYAEAWALTFYLCETRHRAYVRYVKDMAERPALRPYPATERLADFRKAFGDLKPLEADYLEFFADLK